MKQTNTLPKILDSHGSYAIELDEVLGSYLRINFNIKYDSYNKNHSMSLPIINNKVRIRLDGVLRSIFKDEPFEFERKNKLNAILTITANSLTLKYFVVNAALQIGNGVVMDDYVDKRLGIAPKTPLFLGYPKITSILRNTYTEQLKNSRGCPFDESTIDSTVHIRVKRPDGAIETMDNNLDLLIPDELSANGEYIITYTTNDGLEKSRILNVVNAGEVIEPIDLTLDILFERNGSEAGNSHDFENTTFLDEVKVETAISKSVTPNTKFRFRITDPNGEVVDYAYSNSDNFYINPYLESNARRIYKPTIDGTYKIETWVRYKGQEFYYFENYNLTIKQNIDSPQEPIYEDLAMLITINNSNDINLPIVGNSLEFIFPAPAEYEAKIIGKKGNSEIKWVLSRPNGTQETLTTPGDKYVKIATLTQFYGDYELSGIGVYDISESGIYVLTATFMQDSQEQIITKTLNITYQL